MASSWVSGADESEFGLDALPYGVLAHDGDVPFVAVRIGHYAFDLTAATAEFAPDLAPLFAAPTLDAFLAAGRDEWRRVRSVVADWLSDHTMAHGLDGHLVPLESTQPLLPFTVADFVDGYASRTHAETFGTIVRPGSPPLGPNWLHLPVAYHGRAGTVVVSGTDIIRPSGQREAASGEIEFGPSARVDIEAEVGFVIGTPSTRGVPVAVDDVDDHIFGVVLVNDWSARDIQRYEQAPLGPFLGKSFGTSISGWVLPWAALHAARVPPPPREIPVLPYLRGGDGLDLALEVSLNDTVVSHPPFATMYWTAAQQIAHVTVNGASLRTGDLIASGTISGPGRDERGCLFELTWNGRDELTLGDGSTRTFLLDGDEVVITATAPGVAGRRIGLGEVRGRLVSP